MFNQTMTTYLALGVGIAILMYLIVIYNNLISIKNNVKKAWANIDVLLKQRNDELPKLVETCKQYMRYEKETLEKITETRAAAMRARELGDLAKLGATESLLKSTLGNLFALAENYPDLKTDQTYAHLQNRISGLENAIADRRETYNESVTINNTRIEQFPDIIVAKLLSFKHFQTLDFPSEDLKDVDVTALFKK